MVEDDDEAAAVGNDEEAPPASLHFIAPAIRHFNVSHISNLFNSHLILYIVSSKIFTKLDPFILEQESLNFNHTLIQDSI